MSAISLVIPGRNCKATIGECVRAAIAACSGVEHVEVLYVDDHSEDDSPDLAAAAGANVLRSTRRGAGAARNAGWRAASHPLVWFVDSDCVASEDALQLLLPHFEDPSVGAVSGAYDNAVDGSLVATLIHEEIGARHREMPVEVDFLATFNVVYRRELLVELDGFDERYLRGQDAELSFRAHRAGSKLHFELASRVAHHHERSLRRYLRAQYHQGYWRAFLHTEHAGHAGGDSYSKLSDHLQPPVALLTLGAPLTVLFVPPTAASALVGALLALLLILPLAMARRIAAAAGARVAAAYVPFSALRAFWRGAGFAAGVLDKLTRRDVEAPPASAEGLRRRAQVSRWLTWLVAAHLLWGLVRLPGKVFDRRAEEVVLYQKTRPEQWFLRGDALQGAEVITWLRENTPPSCVIAWQGERLGVMEFAVGLLSPRYFVRVEDAERVAATTGVPIATAELDGQRGHVTVTATRTALEVSVR